MPITYLATGFTLGITFTAACLGAIPVWLAILIGISVSIVCHETNSQ